VDKASGEETDSRLLTEAKADYLNANRGGGVAMSAQSTVTLDSAVGFSSAPASAALAKANQNVGVNTVVGGWAYQGSRAAHDATSLYNAQGRNLNAISAREGISLWQATVVGKNIVQTGQVFSPPSLGQDFMYLSSGQGVLASVRKKDGQLGFAYAFDTPMVFQPALALGNVYVGTADGRLICVKTGSPDADGWYAWGGNAQHNR
jgi:hypothetical protein